MIFNEKVIGKPPKYMIGFWMHLCADSQTLDILEMFTYSNQMMTRKSLEGRQAGNS